MFDTELALGVLGVDGVKGDHFGICLGFHLVLKILIRIPIKETPLFLRSPMQIAIKEQPLL